MNTPAILHQLDLERKTLHRRGEGIEILPDVTRLASPDGAQHSVIFSALSAETAEAVIAREAGHYRGLGVAAEWKAYRHDRPGDLVARLGRHGFVCGAEEAVVVLDLARPPAWVELAGAGTGTPTGSAGIAVVRIDQATQLPLFRRAAEAIFKKDWTFTTNQLAEEIRSGSAEHRAYVAMAGDEPVSVGRLYTHRQSAFGGLYGGGTIEAFRGRGFYRAIVAARARDAIAAGAKYLIVDALPTSRPILQRMGFVHVTDTWPCVLEIDANGGGE